MEKQSKHIIEIPQKHQEYLGDVLLSYVLSAPFEVVIEFFYRLNQDEAFKERVNNLNKEQSSAAKNK